MGDILVEDGFRERLTVDVNWTCTKGQLNAAQAPATMYEVDESYDMTQPEHALPKFWTFGDAKVATVRNSEGNNISVGVLIEYSNFRRNRLARR
ncbi:hypothetical protein BDR04DRAFT_1088763 [Suillus decipiens]|nr:hypothetical protein BDR04DRAFT_1088763 [Suillus decipiens]